MFLPAAALLIMGLLLGLVPGLKSATVKACSRFENSNAYAAHVLDSQPMPQLGRAESAPSHPFERLIPVLAAMAIAAMALFAPRGFEITAWLAKPLHVLHRLHSGHIGDYIAFLTFGLACFGLICAYCFR
jgi:multicomponent Na+:H+ antiporter subunit D